METIVLQEKEYLQMKQTIEKLQNEVIELKELYFYIIQHKFCNLHISIDPLKFHKKMRFFS